MHNMGTLIKYEWKKLLKKRMVVISLVIIFAMMVFGNVAFLMQSATVSYKNAEGVEVVESINGTQMLEQWKANARALHGRAIDSDLVKEIITTSGQNPLVSHYDEVSFILRKMTGKKITELQGISTEELYADWRETLAANYKDYYLTEKEIAYWEKMADAVETPLVYQYALGWANVWEMALTNSVMLLLLVTICLAGIFTDEHKLRTDQMILCTQNFKQIFYAKMLTGSLFGVGCAVLLYAICYLFSFLLYGTDGYHAMLQQEMTTYPYTIAFGEATMIIFGLTVLSGILESIFAMFLSEALNNNLAVMSIMTGIMLLTQFIYVPERYRVLSQIWSYLPTNLLTYWGFSDGRLVPFFGGYLTSFQFCAVLYPILSVIFVFLTYKAYKRFQVTGR